VSKKTSFKGSFDKLTWEDLHDWAGDKIVSRGRSYQKQKTVKDLGKTPDGGLIAWVIGTERYLVKVILKDGILSSHCTCPYWDQCKHAVAVVLEYLNKCSNNETVAPIPKNDPRPQLIEEMIAEEEQYDNKYEQDADNEEYQFATGNKKVKGWLEPFLSSKTKIELIDIITKFANRFPQVLQDLGYQSNLAVGAIDQTVKKLRQEIESLTAEPGWSNAWNDESNIPDFSNIAEHMNTLLENGYTDELLDLGKFLLQKGTDLVEMSDDDGDTSEEISICLETVFRALHLSSLSRVEQMVWAVDAELEDNYDLCGEGAGRFWSHKFEENEWNQLADTLIPRLKRYSPPGNSSSHSRDYHRDQLTNKIIHALKNAGRMEEVIALCKKEAEKTDSYDRLVKHLKDLKRWEEAEEWIVKGIEATYEKYPGIARKLREELQDIRRRKGDRLGTLSLLADDFFIQPSLTLYNELKKESKKDKIWDDVKIGILNYLEKGNLPSGGPIPTSGLKISKRFSRSTFPIFQVLIDIAITEKHMGDLLYWWDLYTVKNVYWIGLDTGDKVAEALAKDYPDKALNIWQQMANNRISKTVPKGYREAAVFLKKVRKLLNGLGKEKAWIRYIAELKEIHSRKRKLLEILDSLEERPIFG